MKTIIKELLRRGDFVQAVAEEMGKDWGDTYWYYYFFGRQYTKTVGRKHNEVQS